ncbi:hypothetical protein E2C01_050669 [Portunus trituberculatus]|uniref:Uncharacterized protein n=1 Tax=Portunus trituberculatus TaxID=210409 RepID=A0A5B7GJL0_PORTR|nr:hypothetical protein [Portunus trituberculatus]
MTVEHMSRVSDIGGVLLQYLRCAMFFWHRYHEDVQPRQARVQAISDQAKQACAFTTLHYAVPHHTISHPMSKTLFAIHSTIQLHSKLVTKEKRVKGLKEEVSSLKSRLREEERFVISLRSKRAMVEEELETVLEVITHLSPHSER